MARRLYILRHAQSPMLPSGDDFNRPLSQKGCDDMADLAKTLREQDIAPSCVFCSPAKRTRQTLDILLPDLPDPAITFPETLYNAPAGVLYELLKNTDDKHHSVLLLGHNPGMHQIVAFLTGELLPAYQPGTLSVIECDCNNWTGLMPEANTLNHVFEAGHGGSGE